jgi:ubiquinone/menaquinone biosynthesis C-methylase UbiE
VLGEGMEQLLLAPEIELVETDVSFGPRTALISDAHNIPFVDSVFDAVIAQAVLEHVVDPHRCVEEIFRVLKPEGLVYAETPFMQQVHGGRYDFTRFTLHGHRRLFRRFEEVDSGMTGGPGMALAWSFSYFLQSISPGRVTGWALEAAARLTAFWLKYIDELVAKRPAAMDAAAGLYFLGRKSEHVLDDRDLVSLYDH